MKPHTGIRMQSYKTHQRDSSLPSLVHAKEMKRVHLAMASTFQINMAASTLDSNFHLHSNILVERRFENVFRIPMETRTKLISNVMAMPIQLRRPLQVGRSLVLYLRTAHRILQHLLVADLAFSRFIDSQDRIKVAKSGSGPTAKPTIAVRIHLLEAFNCPGVTFP